MCERRECAKQAEDNEEVDENDESDRRNEKSYVVARQKILIS
jgi:hypothetical protein